MLSLIMRFLGNWKVIAGVLAIVGIVGSGLVISNYSNKIDSQRQEIANKELMLDQVQDALKNNLDQQKREQQARDAADQRYQDALRKKEKDLRKLEEAIEKAGEDDEKFDECMSYDLPNGVYDSLFNTTEGGNSG